MDFESIMMYDPMVFSRNGHPTMRSLVQGKRMLRPHEKPNISEGDVMVINTLYQCPATTSVNRPIDRQITSTTTVRPVVRPRPVPEQPSIRPQPVTQRPFVRPQPVRPVIENDDDFWPGLFGRRTQPEQPRTPNSTSCPAGYTAFGRFCIPQLGRFFWEYTFT